MFIPRLERGTVGTGFVYQKDISTLAQSRLTKYWVPTLSTHNKEFLDKAVSKTCDLSPSVITFRRLMYLNCLIIHMKKLFDSDWLRAVQFKCNTSAKSVTPVQITHRNSG